MMIDKIEVGIKMNTKEIDIVCDYLEKRIIKIEEMANKAKIEPIEITINTRIVNEKMKLKEMIVQCVSLKIDELTANIKICGLMQNDIYFDGYRQCLKDIESDKECLDSRK